MNKSLWIVTIGVLIAALAFVSRVEAASDTKPIVWRYHTPHTKGRVNFQVEKDWADMITKATHGRIEVEMYPGSALGFKDADMLRTLKAGLVETSFLYGGYYTRDAPILSLVMPQMVFSSRDEMLRVLPFAIKQYKKLYGEWGVTVATVWPTLNCHIAVISKEPYDTLASLKGKKIRVWEAQQVDTLHRLGIGATVIPQNDLYLAMKMGVVDGAIHYPEAIRTLSLNETAKYFSIIQPVPVIEIIGISNAALQSLPTDLRDIVLRTSEKHREKWSRETQKCEGEKKAITWATTHGMSRLPDFTEKDRRSLSSAAIKVWKERAERIGPNALKMQQLMQGELTKNINESE